VAISTLPAVYRLTYSDWLRFPDDGRLYEIVGGELFVNPPPSIRHQRVSRNLELAIAAHLAKTASGEIFDAPVGVRLSEEDVPEPDLVVVLSEHADRIGEQVIEGTPDLVVEILSPGSAQRDVGVKRALYERYGVPEYWIADPERRTVEVLVLESGLFVSHGVYGRDAILLSVVLAGFTVALNTVF
jgi:Uma2 family endonuclease